MSFQTLLTVTEHLKTKKITHETALRYIDITNRGLASIRE